jgi:hypothetical protein
MRAVGLPGKRLDKVVSAYSTQNVAIVVQKTAETKPKFRKIAVWTEK